MTHTGTTVIGIDSSTQSCKALLVETERGTVLRHAQTAHPDGTAVDPSTWVRALRQCLAQLELTELPAEQRPVAMGIAGQQHGMVALDSAGAPVHDALLWNDTRSATDAADMLEQLGAEQWQRRTGLVPAPSFTITKLAWLARCEPGAAARVESVLLPHDYLGLALTGQAATDRSEASGTGYFNPTTNAYDTDLLSRFFGHVPRLPRVCEPDGITGTVTDEWAEFGIAGLPVSAGMGDNAAAGLGLGARRGQVIVSVGTSGTVFASTADPTRDSSGVVAGFADATGGYLPLIATLNASRVMAATARAVHAELPEFARLAQAGPADADGLTLLPYLDGERTPNLPDATGTLLGLTRQNFTDENLARASVLSVLSSLRDGIEALRGAGVSVDSVLLIGGGAKSSALQHAAADMFGVDVQVPTAAEYVALGAARQAAWAAVGALPGFPIAAEAEFSPTGDPGIAAYRQRYVAARTQIHGV